MIKKVIISQLRKILKEKTGPQVDQKMYLDFLNSGIFVDLDRVKAAAYKIFDKILSDFDRPGGDHTNRHTGP